MKVTKQKNRYVVYDSNNKIIIITTNKFCIESAVKLYEERSNSNSSEI